MRAVLTAMLLIPAVTGAVPEPREFKAADGTVIPYRWSKPPGIEPGKTYPLVLFLHGAGERGSDNKAQLKHGVMPIIQTAEKLGTPVFLIAPQCPADRWWSAPVPDRTMLQAAAAPNPLMAALLELITEVQKTHPVNPRRFHVTGISMGGFGTWDLLARAPGRIARAIPICGGGDPALAASFKQVPVWAFHGDADEVVPAAATRLMIEALEKAGARPKATFYPGVGHDSWTQTYQDPEVIRWFLTDAGGQ